jgi:hypothetical protein
MATWILSLDSKQMLKHYSHIRMEAKRRAVDLLVIKPAASVTTSEQFLNGVAKDSAKVAILN